MSSETTPLADPVCINGVECMPVDNAITNQSVPENRRVPDCVAKMQINELLWGQSSAPQK